MRLEDRRLWSSRQAYGEWCSGTPNGNSDWSIDQERQAVEGALRSH